MGYMSKGKVVLVDRVKLQEFAFASGGKVLLIAALPSFVRL